VKDRIQVITYHLIARWKPRRLAENRDSRASYRERSAERHMEQEYRIWIRRVSTVPLSIYLRESNPEGHTLMMRRQPRELDESLLSSS
jgi:hypothetical protein